MQTVVYPVIANVDNFCAVLTINRCCLRHSKTRPSPHCRVLPPGEFSGMTPEPVHCENFTVC